MGDGLSSLNGFLCRKYVAQVVRFFMVEVTHESCVPELFQLS